MANTSKPLKIANGRIRNVPITDSFQLATLGLGATPTDNGLTIVPSSASNIGILVQGASLQTANLLEFQDSNFNLILAVDPAGRFEVPDNDDDAFVVKAGSDVYIDVNTLDAGSSITFGNSTTNPNFIFSGSGSVQFGGGVGTSGQVLTSNGSGSAPTWQDITVPLPIPVSNNAVTSVLEDSASNKYLEIDDTTGAEKLNFYVNNTLTLTMDTTAAAFVIPNNSGNLVISDSGYSAPGGQATAVGYLSDASAADTTAFGYLARATSSGGTALGHGATAAHASIALGKGATTIGHQQCVIGSESTPITTVTIGTGSSSSTTLSTVIRATNGNADSVNGAALTMIAGDGGDSTGTAPGAGAGVALRGGDAGDATSGGSAVGGNIFLTPGLGSGGGDDGSVIIRAPGSTTAVWTFADTADIHIADNNGILFITDAAHATPGTSSTAVGFDSDASGDNSTAYGNASKATGTSSISVGQNSRANGNYGIAIGMSSHCAASGSIALGTSSFVSSANVLAIGGNEATSNLYDIKDVFIGRGQTNTQSSAIDVTIAPSQAEPGQTDRPAGNLTLRGGRSTGAAAGGHVVIQTAAPTVGSSGTLNSYTNIAEFTDDQKIGFHGVTPVAQASDTGALTDNTGGTTDGTVAAVSGSGADATINDNFAELLSKYNALRDVLRNLGLMA